MYKLIALDMDGTLLNPHGQITPRTHAAIAAARAQGVTVVLTSGRPLEGMTPYLAELGLTGQDDYVICYNGALVQQVADQRILRSQLLTGSDATLLAETRDALEDVLLANGMAQADTALLAQDAFGAQVEHARYFTVNDLAAMMAMQYDNQGLADLWPILETAMFAPNEEQWLEASPEPLLRYVGGEVRMALFDPAGWCAHYAQDKNDCDRLQRVYEQYMMRQRQMAAVLEAHGIDVLYVHVNAGQDAKALLAH